MLYQLFESLRDLPGAGLLRYISFRAAGAALFAFMLALLLGRGVIAWLGRVGIGEDIDSPSQTLTDLHIRPTRRAPGPALANPSAPPPPWPTS